ncbi:MAG: argininosuccinate lyase [Nitrososphaeraceae archaeon]
MYRSRHKADLDRNTLNFLSSIDIDNKILYYDILCTKAHVIMLSEIRLLNQDELVSIIAELDRVLRHPQNLVRDGFEDIHEALETHLIRKIGMDVGGKIQTGRSRNDQVITDIRIKARDDLVDIIFHVINLVRLLLQKSQENLNSIMPLYTHLQQAQIGNFAHYLISYSESLIRDMDRLFSLYDRINESPLGAGPIGGSLFPLNRRKTARLLGFNNIISNTIDATSSRDFMIEFTSDISSIMITLSRISEDLIIWSSQEFGFIEINDKHASTSSAMPQKKNPDPLELMRSKAAIVIGNLASIMTILKSLPSGYSRDLQDIKIPFWNSIEIGSSSLVMMRDIIDSLQVKKEAMAKASDIGYAVSLDIAELLVLKHKLPFRTAHNLVGALVSKSIGKDNASLKLLSTREVKEILDKMKILITPDKLVGMLNEINLERSIATRRSEGAPNPKQQIRYIKKYQKLLKKYLNNVKEMKNEIDIAKENLTNAISHIRKSKAI